MAQGIALIIIFALLADWLCRSVKLPGLIGMLVVGVVLGPQALGLFDVDLLLVSADLRLIALIVILLRVGFELNRKTLERVGGRVLLLAFLPATCEGLAITLVASSLLNFSLLEAGILASVLAAVSPAVVVPAMIHFIKERKGAQKDIPAMVMAAASVDDIFVIVCHSIILGLYISKQVNLAWQTAGIPLSLFLGALAGIIIGNILFRFFDKFDPRATKRVLLVLAVSILLVQLQHLLAGNIPFAGLVSAMAIGFVILQKREKMAHELSAKLAKIWVFAEIVLFTMVGAQVDLAVAWQAGAAGLLIIFLGLVARGIGVFICLLGSRLNLKERIFVIAAFSPKATVQAAIGSAPLMAMKVAGMPLGPGQVILAIAVLSIIVTAPTGAWLINLLGNKILVAAPESFNDAYETAIASNPDAD